jgi:hypothetical protein
MFLLLGRAGAVATSIGPTPTLLEKWLADVVEKEWKSWAKPRQNESTLLAVDHEVSGEMRRQLKSQTRRSTLREQLSHLMLLMLGRSLLQILQARNTTGSF